jgi:alpha-tubulin suppressor-like RCC1 family protein
MKNFTLAILVIILTNTLHSQCFSKISAGDYHNVGIKSNGTIYTWGNRSLGYGALGLGAATGPAILAPTQVGTATYWTSVSTGSVNTFAIKSDGTLWGTGSDIHGELGDGTYGSSHIIYNFIQIGSDTNWKTTSGTRDSSVGLKTNGTLWGWGFNNNGQVGDGTTIERHTPVQIGTDTNWKAITSGMSASFNIALKTNGTLWGWGVNGGANCLGQGIGTSTIAYYSSPIQIGTDSNWSSMDSGFQHTLAIKINGTLYVFGGGVNGSCGHGLTDAPFVSPTQIGTDSNWSQVSAGANTSYAIKTDGTLWAWGQNDYGQLGDGTMVNKGYPTQIGTDTNWSSVQAGYRHCIALKTDGSLWAWGDNSWSQLGIGTSSSSTIPVQITVAGCALGNEAFNKTPINLYPNPTNGRVTLNNSEAQYQSVAVYNYLGQEVTQQKLNESNNQTVDLSSFSNGVYLFKLQSENSSETLKVIKR